MPNPEPDSSPTGNRACDYDVALRVRAEVAWGLSLSTLVKTAEKTRWRREYEAWLRSSLRAVEPPARTLPMPTVEAT